MRFPQRPDFCGERIGRNPAASVYHRLFVKWRRKHDGIGEGRKGGGLLWRWMLCVFSRCVAHLLHELQRRAGELQSTRVGLM